MADYLRTAFNYTKKIDELDRCGFWVFARRDKRTLRMRGSHQQYRHPEKPELRTVTVAGHPAEDIPKGKLA